MSQNLTPYLNKNNVEYVKSLVALKSGSNPTIVPMSSAMNVITDMDVHPYPRYFRGVAGHDTPVIMELEAGFRTRNDNCYKPIYKPKKEEPIGTIWQPTCTCITPANPDPALFTSYF